MFSKIYSQKILEEMNGKNYHEVKRVFVTCRAIIEECCGPREFNRSVPCIRFKEEQKECKYSFPTTVILSFFVGIVGGDRFYLGHTASAVGKFFSLGGLGVWWIIDLVLLLSGELKPEGGHSWCNNY